MKDRATKEQFILDWLKSERGADALNSGFHAAYHEKFGGRRHECYWGAQTVYEAQKLMAAMAKEGKLNRGRVGLSTNWQPGFPKWVWCYRLPEGDKR